MPKNSAGILFMLDDSVLLLERSENVSESGLWGIPGGGAEPHEDNALQTALRETEEEIGFVPDFEFFSKHVRIKKKGKQYVTYIVRAKNRFTPILDFESSDWAWVPINKLHEYDLHPGLKKTLIELYR
jgi:8-oxo-dGTP pyrophosphatase MutT (NUDIX family)